MREARIVRFQGRRVSKPDKASEGEGLLFDLKGHTFRRHMNVQTPLTIWTQYSLCNGSTEPCLDRLFVAPFDVINKELQDALGTSRWTQVANADGIGACVLQMKGKASAKYEE